MAVVIETSIGNIVVDLYVNERPKACENFLKLCKIKYYNYCLFHSVQENLVAQSGDPTGTGRGGASIFEKLFGEQARYFEAEKKPRIKHVKLGTLSMVNNGDDHHGSQFFITLAENIDYLDDQHTVFGEVAEGFEVLDKFNETYCDSDHRPFKDIRIYHTVVLDDPFDDPSGLGEFIPDRSPEPTAEQLEGSRIGAEEDIDKMKGKSEAEVQELLEAQEEKTNAHLLEMVGDLPTADTKAPDNILFVCKLNPVTSSEDLEIIFSRFGTIVSCEVIKDQKSGESLQYAFIEFEKPEQCEDAFFKMDNVLIDDRRIHVDFSQSVSKLQQGGKNKLPQTAQLRIKDLSRKDGYDYVYSDEEDGDERKKKAGSRRTRDERDRDHRKSTAAVKSREKRTTKSRSRSRSRDRRDKKREDSPRERQSRRKRSRSRSRHRRSRSRDKHTKRGHRSRSRDRNRRR